MNVDEIALVEGAATGHSGEPNENMYIHLKNGKTYYVRQTIEQISALLSCKAAPKPKDEQTEG